MSEASPQREFLDHLLNSVLNEPDQGEIRAYNKKTRRGRRDFVELLPSDDDRDLLDANDGKLTDAIATVFDAYGSKHQKRARFELADLDGDDYEDDPEDESDDESESNDDAGSDEADDEPEADEPEADESDDGDDDSSDGDSTDS